MMRHLKKTSLSCFLIFSALSVVKADVIGFEAGVNYWDYSISGDIESALVGSGNARVDLEDDNNLTFFAALEHPVPFLPNIKLQQNNLDAVGLVRVNDVGFAPGQSNLLNATIDLSHTDLILYYEVLDNWVNLDVGISGKYFNGNNRLMLDAQTSQRIEFDDWVALAYAKAQFDLPFTGLSAAATLEALSLNDNDVTDLDLALKYTTKPGLGASVGYRVLDVDLEAGNNFRSDLKADGFYLGVHLDF